MFTSPPQKRLQSRPRHPASVLHSQNGIVLVVALIMLIVISLLAAVSVRNATSSEGVSANVRQTQLASQAAETALRYCENTVVSWATTGVSTVTFGSSPPGTTAVTFATTYVQDLTTTLASMNPSNWDSNASNKILVLAPDSVNHSITSTFSRPPECMIERLAPSTSSTYSTTFNITARGFGPEVPAADASRSRPVGAVIWFQSTIEIQ